MARSSYGQLLGWGLAIGAVAGAMSLFRDKAKASSLQGGARATPSPPPGAPVKQRFHVGDEVTVTGGTGSTTAAHGTDTTFIVRAATLTPTGWQYDLGVGAPMPQGAMHMVEPAAKVPAIVVATPVAPIQGGPKMTARQQRITDLLGLVKVEKDAAKLAALKAELVKLAQEESAALKAVPTTPQPLYQVGLEVRFGKRKAKITAAQQDAQGVWQYTAYVESGELFGIGTKSYNFNEAQLRQAMQKEVGVIRPGQFAVAGVTVYRNGQGGTIVAVSNPGASGEFVYTIQGWPNAVTQSELLSILRRA